MTPVEYNFIQASQWIQVHIPCLFSICLLPDGSGDIENRKGI